MAEAQTITCSSACTVTLQVEVTTPLLSLTPAEAGPIAGAVLAVWAVGFGIRMLIRTVNDGNSNHSSESET